jgi:hypothetical protein
VFATDADENPIPGFEEIVEESVNENEIIV